MRTCAAVDVIDGLADVVDWVGGGDGVRASLDLDGAVAAGGLDELADGPAGPPLDLPADRQGCEDDRQVRFDRVALAVVDRSGLQVAFGHSEGVLDGLITNDKFCCVRRVQLSLTWSRRPLRLRASFLRCDVAVSGEPDDPDPDVDRLPPVQRAPRRRAPVGSGLSAAGAPGVPGWGALPDADRRGGA